MRGTVWCPFAPLGPSGGNDYFTPNFWAGRSSETVGRRGPRASPKVSPIIRGTCGAQSSNLILPKNLPWTPPLNGEAVKVAAVKGAVVKGEAVKGEAVKGEAVKGEAVKYRKY